MQSLIPVLFTMLAQSAPAPAPAQTPAPVAPAGSEAVVLPACMVPVPRPDGAGGRQDEVLRRVREAKAPMRVVFLGDSITQGWEEAGTVAWARDFEPMGALQIGVGGDRTEHVLWRLEKAPLTALDPEVIVLMIGTNNASTGRDSGELIVRAVRAVVDTLLQQCPRAHVIVLDMPPRGQRMNPLRGLVLQVNQALSQVPWNQRVSFLRVSDEFVRGDGSLDEAAMPDFLHFSPAGYERWARSIRPAVSSALQGHAPHPTHPALASPPPVPAQAPAAQSAASSTARTGT
jgi:lysophospholipase L1-like esterase